MLMSGLVETERNAEGLEGFAGGSRPVEGFFISAKDIFCSTSSLRSIKSALSRLTASADESAVSTGRRGGNAGRLDTASEVSTSCGLLRLRFKSCSKWSTDFSKNFCRSVVVTSRMKIPRIRPGFARTMSVYTSKSASPLSPTRMNLRVGKSLKICSKEPLFLSAVGSNIP